MAKSKVLFLCTGNSARSQMAEGLVNHFLGDRWEAFSAGTQPSGYVHPLAIRAMAELGIDISDHRSKSTEELKDVEFDAVVTVCGHADEHCPVFIGNAVVIHKGFDDPPKLAENSTSDEEKMAPYRRVRDEIRAYIETLPESLQ